MFGEFLWSVGENGGHQQQGTGTLHYTRDFLFGLRATSNFDSAVKSFIPSELLSDSASDSVNGREKVRKRGRRGGVRRRLRRNKTQPSLPSVVLSNVRSLNPNGNNMNLDELRANCRFLSDFRNACLLCLTET